MNTSDPRAHAEELRNSGSAYVLATVVRAERPTSAKPGAHAPFFPADDRANFRRSVGARWSEVEGEGVGHQPRFSPNSRNRSAGMAIGITLPRSSPRSRAAFIEKSAMTRGEVGPLRARSAR